LPINAANLHSGIFTENQIKEFELPQGTTDGFIIRGHDDMLLIESFNDINKLYHIYKIPNSSSNIVTLLALNNFINVHKAAFLNDVMFYSLKSVLYELDLQTLEVKKSDIVSSDVVVNTPIVSTEHYIFFNAHDKTQSYGFELWVSNGNRFKTKMVADLTEGPFSSSIRDFLPLSHGMAFIRNSPTGGEEVWFVGHNDLEAKLIKSSEAITISTTNKNSDLLFIYTSNIYGGTNLRCYDAAKDNIEILHTTFEPANTLAQYATNLNGWCYYLNTYASSESTLFQTDGSKSGTTPIKTWTSTDIINNPTNLVIAKEKLFYSAYSYQTGRELFVMDLPDYSVTQENPLKIVPNPVTDIAQLYVEGRTSDEETVVEVYSTAGQMIRQSTSNTNPIELNLEGLTPGVYVVRLSNGMATKFIKK
jgi:ELWxxDGT repeat protein